MYGPNDEYTIDWRTLPGVPNTLAGRDGHGRTWLIEFIDDGTEIFNYYQARCEGTLVVAFYYGLAECKRGIEVLMRRERYVEQLNGIDWQGNP